MTLESKACLRPTIDITGLLLRWSDGDREALDRLMPVVYDELRGLAASHLRRERTGHTLETSALVHEAFLRLLEQRVRWQSRSHFFGIAARTMRRVLVDHARRHLYAKRGGGARPLPLDEVSGVASSRAAELVAVDDALGDLAAVDPRQARIVELRYFGGLTSAEIAALDGLSIPTVTRRWRLARAWLFRHLDAEDGDGD